MNKKMTTYQKDLKMVTESLNSITRKQGEDKAFLKQGNEEIKEKNERAKVEADKTLKAIEKALYRILNFEIYHKAITYKQKEKDDEIKRKQKEKDEILQAKIDEKQESVNMLRELVARKEEELRKNSDKSNILSDACSGKLDHLQEFREDIEYVYILFLILMY